MMQREDRTTRRTTLRTMTVAFLVLAVFAVPAHADLVLERTTPQVGTPETPDGVLEPADPGGLGDIVPLPTPVKNPRPPRIPPVFKDPVSGDGTFSISDNVRGLFGWLRFTKLLRF